MRVLSCFCAKPKSCERFQLSAFTFTSVSARVSIPDVDPPTESNSSSADTDWIGKWCVGLYDDVLYPGIVQGVDDEDFAVKVMHKIGQYRYFLPLLPNNMTKLFAKYKSLLRWVVGTSTYQKPIMNTCSSFYSKCYCDHVVGEQFEMFVFLWLAFLVEKIECIVCS